MLTSSDVWLYLWDSAIHFITSPILSFHTNWHSMGQHLAFPRMLASPLQRITWVILSGPKLKVKWGENRISLDFSFHLEPLSALSMQKGYQAWPSKESNRKEQWFDLKSPCVLHAEDSRVNSWQLKLMVLRYTKVWKGLTWDPLLITWETVLTWMD